MSATELLEAAKHLPRDEQIVLVQALWDSITHSPTAPLSDELKEELDRRIEADDADPHGGLGWDEVKRQVLGNS